jgi:hypothetical protein
MPGLAPKIKLYDHTLFGIICRLKKITRELFYYTGNNTPTTLVLLEGETI